MVIFALHVRIARFELVLSRSMVMLMSITMLLLVLRTYNTG